MEFKDTRKLNVKFGSKRQSVPHRMVLITMKLLPKSPITVRNLKLGMKVRAKVFQIRALVWYLIRVKVQIALGPPFSFTADLFSPASFQWSFSPADPTQFGIIGNNNFILAYNFPSVVGMTKTFKRKRDQKPNWDINLFSSLHCNFSPLFFCETECSCIEQNGNKTNVEEVNFC